MIFALIFSVIGCSLAATQPQLSGNMILTGSLGDISIPLTSSMTDFQQQLQGKLDEFTTLTANGAEAAILSFWSMCLSWLFQTDSNTDPYLPKISYAFPLQDYGSPDILIFNRNTIEASTAGLIINVDNMNSVITNVAESQLCAQLVGYTKIYGYTPLGMISTLSDTYFYSCDSINLNATTCQCEKSADIPLITDNNWSSYSPTTLYNNLLPYVKGAFLESIREDCSMIFCLSGDDCIKDECGLCEGTNCNVESLWGINPYREVRPCYRSH